MRVLLTGATGFLGRAILARLPEAGHAPRVLARSPAPPEWRGIDWRAAGDLASVPAGELAVHLDGVDAVIHAAGHAHAMAAGDAEQHHLHERINRDATIRLAEASAVAGARFVFVSSIKALGPPQQGRLIEGRVLPAPDPYGRAKAEAETAVRRLLPANHVILQPALVVGPEARGNLERLLRLAMLPLPLPFGLARAGRAMIAREDIVALVLRALDDPAMAGETYLAADPDAPGLADIITELRAGMARAPGLLPVPTGVLSAILAVFGRAEEAERLFTPLLAEPSVLLALGWRPVLPVRLALRQMGQRAMESRIQNRTVPAQNPAPPA